jgi:hypothetical protein
MDRLLLTVGAGGYDEFWPRRRPYSTHFEIDEQDITTLARSLGCYEI